MKRIVTILLLAAVLALPASLPVTSAALAAQIPQAGCPTGFDLHPLHGDGSDHGHDHVHLGLTVDLNDDMQICVLEVGSRHIHVDNVVR